MLRVSFLRWSVPSYLRIHLCNYSAMSTKLYNQTDFERSFPELYSPTPSGGSSAKYPIRSYQADCIKHILKDFDNGCQSLAISLPTGSGKTVTFCKLLQFLPAIEGASDKTLFLVHRKELATQIHDTLKEMYSSKTVGMEMGPSKATPDMDFVVASVYSMRGPRLHKFARSSFSNIIIDEAHHSPTPSYSKILEYFRQEVQFRLLGFSATLFRADMLSLGSVFEKISYHLEVQELIKLGHLTEPRIVSVHALADLSNVRQHKSDFVVESLAQEVNRPENNVAVVQAWNQMTESGKSNKTTLIFVVNVQHAQDLESSFMSRGIEARVVTSKTPSKARHETILEFRDGKFPVLINCGIFTEGTDMPEIDCIILDRPTKSLGLLMQMIGRGLRNHHAKSHCLVIDMFGASSHVKGLALVPTLVGISPELVQTVKYQKPETESSDGKFVEEVSTNEKSSVGKEKWLAYVKHDSIEEFVSGTDEEFSSINNWIRLDRNSAVLFGPGYDYLRVTINKSVKASEDTQEKYADVEEVISSFENQNDGQGEYCIFLYKEDHIYKSGKQRDVRRFRITIAAGIHSMEAAIQGGDTLAKSIFPVAIISKLAKWRNDQISEKQLRSVQDMLKKVKIEPETHMAKMTSKGAVSNIISLFKHRQYQAIRHLVLGEEENPKAQSVPQKTVKELMDAGFRNRKVQDPGKEMSRA